MPRHRPKFAASTRSRCCRQQVAGLRVRTPSPKPRLKTSPTHYFTLAGLAPIRSVGLDPRPKGCPQSSPGCNGAILGLVAHHTLQIPKGIPEKACADERY